MHQSGLLQAMGLVTASASLAYWMSLFVFYGKCGPSRVMFVHVTVARGEYATAQGAQLTARTWYWPAWISTRRPGCLALLSEPTGERGSASEAPAAAEPARAGPRPARRRWDVESRRWLSILS